MPNQKQNRDKIDPFIYFLTYFLEFVSGMMVYFTLGQQDARLKKHAIQATMLGVIALVQLEFFNVIQLGTIGSFVSFLIWVYCLFVGFEAYTGNDVKVPILSNYVE